jgi:hypothetical protein
MDTAAFLALSRATVPKRYARVAHASLHARFYTPRSAGSFETNGRARGKTAELECSIREDMATLLAFATNALAGVEYITWAFHTGIGNDGRIIIFGGT